MKKQILSIIAVLIITFGYSQTKTFTSKVKITNTPVAAAVDTVLAIDTDGLIKKTLIPISSLTYFVYTDWDVATTYQQFDRVRATDGNIYLSVQTNMGNDPSTDSGTNWIVESRITPGAGSPNINNGYYLNSIEEGINSRANTISGGGFSGNINKITGVETRYATIGGGYDNFIDGTLSTETLDGAASTISGGAHNQIRSTHATITGGSFNVLDIETEYSLISGGTNNVIEEQNAYSLILGGENNILKWGGNVNNSGFRAAIVGGSGNISWGRNSTILSGQLNLIERFAIYSFAQGDSNTIGSSVSGGDISFAIGRSNNVNTTGGNQSGAIGLNNTVDGTNSYAFGRNNNIDSKSYSLTYGNAVVSPHDAAIAFSGRNNSPGNGSNMSLIYTVSQETSGASTQNLSLNGSSTWQTMPENSSVFGTIYIGGSDGINTYAAKIDVSLIRIGTANPVILTQNLTVITADLIINTAPVLTTTTSGRYRILVTGETGKNIKWGGSFIGHQLKSM